MVNEVIAESAASGGAVPAAPPSDVVKRTIELQSEEVKLIDSLLVSRKQPPSLAKLLSTSLVFPLRGGGRSEADDRVPICLELRVGAAAVQQSG